VRVSPAFCQPETAPEAGKGSDFTFFGCAGDGVEGSGWTGFVASMAGAATAALVSNIWLEASGFANAGDVDTGCS